MSPQTLATEKALRPYKKDLLILEQLVTKDFKLKNRRSFLGVLWSVLNPLLMIVVMPIVFSYMFGSNAPNFPLFLIVGNVMFVFVNFAFSLIAVAIVILFFQVMPTWYFIWLPLCLLLLMLFCIVVGCAAFKAQFD